MGIKAIELTPIASYGTTAITPVMKDVQMKAFLVSRTDTTATVKCVLPGDSTVIDIKMVGVASDAATTANVSVGTTVAANEIVSAQDVKTAGGFIRPTTSIQPAALPNLENIPITKDISLWAKYAETGTASTVGGPYTILVEFVR